MRKLVTTAVLLLFGFASFAQLVLKDNTLGKRGALDGNTFIFYTELYNTSKTQITPDWIRTKNELPDTSWYSQICIGDLCYDETASKGTFVESLFANDTSLISVYVTNDGSTSGEASVDLVIFEPGDSLNNHAKASFVFSAYPTGIEENEVKDVQLYPNPAESVVYLKPNGVLDQNNHVEFMDLTGRRVLNYPIGHAEVLVYDVSMLEPGVYLLSIVDEKGKINLTKKLRVR